MESNVFNLLDTLLRVCRSQSNQIAELTESLHFLTVKYDEYDSHVRAMTQRVAELKEEVSKLVTQGLDEMKLRVAANNLEKERADKAARLNKATSLAEKLFPPGAIEGEAPIPH